VSEISIPNSWESIAIKDSFHSISATNKKLKQKDYQTRGKIPVVDQGKDLIGGFTDDDKLKINVEHPIIIFGDHTKIIKFINFDFVVGADGVKVLKPKNYFLPKLFYYFLHCVKFPDKGYARHFQYLQKEAINLPPLNEQNRIVEKIEELFTKLDAAVTELKNVKKQLKRYRQSVLKSAFEGKLTEEWRKSKNIIGDYPLLKDLGEFIDSMKNGIYKPKHFYSNDGVACLRMYNIQSGKIKWYDIKRMNLNENELSEYKLLPGDLLVNRVNSRELVGKTAIITDKLEECVYESKNIRVRLKDELDSKYTNFWFLLSYQKYFMSNTQQTVGMASINQEQIFKMPIKYFIKEEQQKIVEEIESRFSVADKIEEEIDRNLKKTEQLRQSILKKAFEGKLVPQDPNDPPASVLLEQIKKVSQKKK